MLAELPRRLTRRYTGVQLVHRNTEGLWSQPEGIYQPSTSMSAARVAELWTKLPSYKSINFADAYSRRMNSKSAMSAVSGLL